VTGGRERPAIEEPPLAYYPTREQWTARPPGELGIDPDRLARAIAFHHAHETPWARDFLTPGGRYVGVADEPPAPDDVLGPVLARGGPNGLVLRSGLLAAEWGDTTRVDMSFSIAKSYLAVLAGLARMRGLIELDEPVVRAAPDPAYDTPQNRGITWRHLLTQTSEWQGTLWDKPDTIDHHRNVGQAELGAAVKGQPRALQAPGRYWEYNDVRVNRLSLSLLQVLREPLPDVLRRAVMAPIGASETWRWQPYRNSTVVIDGRPMASVPGGSHWGGGLWMSTRDHARFGLLALRNGAWEGHALIDAGWVEEMRRPCPVNPGYGLLWWLNTGGRQVPSAPESAFAARGAGSNVVWIDPERDLVVVVRWIEKSAAPELLRLIEDSADG
jgi:CubicO group peptidase (beta-lactamase class C family)